MAQSLLPVLSSVLDLFFRSVIFSEIDSIFRISSLDESRDVLIAEFFQAEADGIEALDASISEAQSEIAEAVEAGQEVASAWLLTVESEREGTLGELNTFIGGMCQCASIYPNFKDKFLP